MEHGNPMETPSPTTGRRRFVTGLIAVIQTVMVGTLGLISGGAILSPGLARRDDQWLPAGQLGDLVEGSPVSVTLRVARQDGYRQIFDRRTVFLIRDADVVTALDPVCTHLGCRVSWDAAARELRCPCHGGVYDHMGLVKGGPPPAPLPRLLTRIDGAQVLVRI